MAAVVPPAEAGSDTQTSGLDAGLKARSTRDTSALELFSSLSRRYLIQRFELHYLPVVLSSFRRYPCGQVTRLTNRCDALDQVTK